MAKVFIGIPTLNRPHYVRDTIQSVLQQSYQDFMIHVSDNVSTPETAESINQYIAALGDSRVTFHQQTHNIGEYGQGRYFFSKAEGCKYFMILHDDDLILPDYLNSAIDVLEENSKLAYFVANPYIIDSDGSRALEMTDTYLKRHARSCTQTGVIDVLSTHLTHDFTPVSGTFFRYAVLQQSGFVDADCYGLFPFESNIYLRLGDIKAKAWYSSEEFLAFRFHSGSMRSHLSILGNIHVVDNLIHLYKNRCFDGNNEQLRCQFLGRLFRAKAIYNLKVNRPDLAKKSIVDALKTYPLSPNTLATILLVLLAQVLPQLAKSFLSELSEQYTDEEVNGFRLGLNSNKSKFPVCDLEKI